MTQYANLICYSDVRPYEIIARTKTTITVRAMKAVGDPSWKPVWHAGGFAGHCSNQSDQKWIITSDPDAHVMKAHLRKDGHYHSAYGRHVVEDRPRSFYDFNF
jgi:hypothetical protein